MNTKKAIILLAGLAVLLLVVVIFAGTGKPETPTAPLPPTEQEQAVSPTERVVPQEVSQVQQAFPSGFPFEEGLVASASYKYIPANSKEQQATLTYTSKLSLAENAEIFKDFLTEQSYKLANKMEKENQNFYYATKDNNDLSILIQKSNNQVTVSVSYLKR